MYLYTYILHVYIPYCTNVYIPYINVYIYIYIEVLTDASSFTNHCPKERYEGEELKFVRTLLLILFKNILGSIHVSHSVLGSIQSVFQAI